MPWAAELMTAELAASAKKAGEKGHSTLMRPRAFDREVAKTRMSPFSG